MPAGRRARSVALLLAIIGASCLETPAHPVAQGALDLEIAPREIRIRARVPTEEAFVANAYGPEEESTLGSQAEVWEKHGRYLLQHLRVFADGRKLDGSLVWTVPPGSGQHDSAGSTSPPDRIVYDLAYVLPVAPAGRSGPSEIRLEQNLLNEFEFAPGNRWEATFIVRIREPGRPPLEGLLLTSREPLVYACGARAEVDDAGSGPARLDRLRLFRDYLRHGVAHILTGYDHLLFIGALVLATVTLWDLFKIVSAFTLAHTLTLTLAVLDVVRLPGRIVEPMIAASIVFVALENVFWPERSRRTGRIVVAFFFGLFHGLGFAGGLLGAMEGMAGAAVGVAILAFSAGVELGHQVVVLPVFGLLRFAGWARRDEAGRRQVHALAMKYGSALISGAGLLYLFAALF